MDDRFSRLRATGVDGARIEVCRHGGQLLSWVPTGGEEALFVADRADFAEGRAIRGGVPVIFPQFAGRGPLPKHGFARTAAFTVRASGCDADGAARVELALVDDEASRELFPHAFELVQRITAHGATLRHELVVTNRGDVPFAFTTALHGYFAVDDVRAIRIDGLHGVPFEDHAGEPTGEDALRFDREVDRVYRAAPPLRLVDGTRTLAMACEGFREWVVWNPGDALAGRLADLGVDAGRRYVCVEAAVVSEPVEVARGASWRGVCTLHAR